MYVLWLHAFQGAPVYNESVYTWMVTDGLRMEVGFLVDRFGARALLLLVDVRRGVQEDDVELAAAGGHEGGRGQQHQPGERRGCTGG